MKKVIMFLSVLICFAFSTVLFSADITFEFANGQITESGTYYEFDVVAYTNTGGQYIGTTVVYINYSTDAFGESIQTNSKVTVTKGTLIDGDIIGSPFYNVQVNDNSISRLAITAEHQFDANTGGSNAIQNGVASTWCHVKIEIASSSETSSLTFQQSLMSDNEYTYDHSVKFNPVNVGGGLDESLPVEMANMQSQTSSENGVTISWRTESELNTLGFHVWRSVNNEDHYVKMTHALIPGQGNSSSAQEYSFSDKEVQQGIWYFYKVEEVAASGASTFFGPIVAQGVNTIPTEFVLKPNYPNPFNPDTRFKYQLAEDAKVTLRVYDLLGRMVRELVNSSQPAGFYHADWNGTDEAGRLAASGVYFLRMHAGSFQKTQKMTLIR